AAAVAGGAPPAHDRRLPAAPDGRPCDRDHQAATRRRAHRRARGGHRPDVDRLRSDLRHPARGPACGVPRPRRLRPGHRRAACPRGRALRMTLQLVGLSHQVAPVELRERVALDPDAAAALARAFGDAVCLSTCNRTEIYSTGVPEAEVVAALESLAGHSLVGVLYTRHDEEAALHLFRVAAGLDSLVPGEGEILGQVRTAFEAVEPGPFLDRVFRQALAVGKRVRTETAIGESPASVSSAAAALAAQVFGDLEGRRVLLIGAGRIGELAAANLSSRGAQIAYVANRSAENARDLAH